MDGGRENMPPDLNLNTYEKEIINPEMREKYKHVYSVTKQTITNNNITKEILNIYTLAIANNQTF